MDIRKFPEIPESFHPFLDRLAAIYRKMDARYEEAASAYGFVCSGCRDNCCRTRFHHHTLIEYFYLKKGLSFLSPDDQAAICSAAQAADSQWKRIGSSNYGIMCPLNETGRCRLYAYRPMICRLHGIPHELNHPVRGRIQSPGCHEFIRQCGQKEYVLFDRTPLYLELADLEKSFRPETGIGIKMKQTIAEMLSDG